MYTMQLRAQAILSLLPGLPYYQKEMELKMALAERYAAEGYIDRAHRHEIETKAVAQAAGLQGYPCKYRKRVMRARRP